MTDLPGRPVTLFVPGPWADATAVQRALASDRWTVEWIENDGHFGEAFRFARLSPEQVAAVDRSRGAVVIEGRLELPREGAAFAEAGRALAAVGALGIRVEQSKAAWAASAWAEQVEAGELFTTLVVTLLGVESVETCGMHLFGLPDARVEGRDSRVGQRIVHVFCNYQLDEDPLLLTGHTFRPDEDTPRRVLERWPDDRYPASHPCHNPFGLFRLGSAQRSAPTRLAVTFMPALVAILLAAEQKAGRALTQSEVEALRDAASCVTMDHRDARALERTRGYADLDPELVWQQWQLVRARG